MKENSRIERARKFIVYLMRSRVFIHSLLSSMLTNIKFDFSIQFHLTNHLHARRFKIDWIIACNSILVSFNRFVCVLCSVSLVVIDFTFPCDRGEKRFLFIHWPGHQKQRINSDKESISHCVYLVAYYAFEIDHCLIRSFETRTHDQRQNE